MAPIHLSQHYPVFDKLLGVSFAAENLQPAQPGGTQSKNQTNKASKEPYQPIQRSQDVFQVFESSRFTEKPESQSATGFFVKEIKENAPIKSYLDSMKRYEQTLISEPGKALATALIAGGLTVVQTMFRKNQSRVETLFLLGFLWYPVSAAVKAIPKMMQSYKLAKSGEPTEAKTQFRQAFNEFVYQTFHNYFKPLTISAYLIFPFLNPHAFLKYAHSLTRVVTFPAQQLSQWFRKGKTIAMVDQALARLEKRQARFLARDWVKSWDRPARWLEQQGDRLLQRFKKSA